ncbi:hypothetical protein KC345_g406 [Hortaea werneckii]|nr:hypothetical protein KC345_g406 [Hortaea werneckii]
MSSSGDSPISDSCCRANNHGEILGVTGAFLGVALIIVSLRLYVRSRILHYVGADDYLMLVAMFMATATFICFRYLWGAIAKTLSSIGLFNSIINILTDLVFAILPIPIIVKLKVNLRTKCTLVFVLSLGFVACAAGIAKAQTQTTFMDDLDPYWHDGFVVWNMVELCLGILAASLPALKPLFSSILASSATMLGMSSGGGYRSKSRAHRTGQSWQQHPSASHIIAPQQHFPSYHLEDYARGPPSYNDPPPSFPQIAFAHGDPRSRRSSTTEELRCPDHELCD